MKDFNLDFLVLGAPKAGTTYLDALLSSHPQVATSIPKESRYFDLHFDKGIEYLANHFSLADNNKLRGDCSPQNLQCSFVPERVFEQNPAMKLIVTLRDPIKRAYSNWWMKYSRGIETRGFEDCINQCLECAYELQSDYFAGPDGEKRWLDQFKKFDAPKVRAMLYLNGSLYAQQIERYLRFFPRQQLLVLPQRSLLSPTDSLLEQLGGFLGVDSSMFMTNVEKKNEAMGNTGRVLRTVADQLGVLKIVPSNVQIAIRGLLRKFGDNPPPMAEETQRLLKDFFRPHNEQLTKLMGKEYWN